MLAVTFAQRTIKSIKMSATMALIMLSVFSFGNAAFAAGLTPAAGLTSASDKSTLPIGKLSLVASDARSGILLANATVLVVDANAERVAKGLTNSAGVFEVKLQAGIYKITVFADNHKEFSQVVTLTGNQVTDVKAGLQPIIQPNS